MVSKRPECDPEGRFSISETCKLLGLNRDTLRIYTDNHLIANEWRPRMALRKRDSKPKSPQKVYRGKEILRFWDSKI